MNLSKSKVRFDNWEWGQFVAVVSGFVSLLCLFVVFRSTTPESIIGSILFAAIAIFAGFWQSWVELDFEKKMFQRGYGFRIHGSVSSGRLDEIFCVKVDRIVQASRYSSYDCFPVCIVWVDASVRQISVFESQSFQTSARFASELADRIGVKVDETESLRAFRAEFGPTPYDANKHVG
ncbi:MAG: hypothetical protein ABL962_06835 [Fimbriimonadaceae bacterium]